MSADPRPRQSNGLSSAAIAVGLGVSAVVWLVLDALKGLL